MIPAYKEFYPHPTVHITPALSALKVNSVSLFKAGIHGSPYRITKWIDLEEHHGNVSSWIFKDFFQCWEYWPRWSVVVVYVTNHQIFSYCTFCVSSTVKSRQLTQWSMSRCGSNFKRIYSANICYGLSSWALLVKLLSWEFHRTPLISSQSTMVQVMAIRQQVFTQANYDPDICYHLALLGHNKLIIPILIMGLV